STDVKLEVHNALPTSAAEVIKSRSVKSQVSAHVRRQHSITRFSRTKESTLRLCDNFRQLTKVVFVVEEMNRDAQPADTRRVALRDQDTPVQEPLETRGIRGNALPPGKGHNAGTSLTFRRGDYGRSGGAQAGDQYLGQLQHILLNRRDTPFVDKSQG